MSKYKLEVELDLEEVKMRLRRTDGETEGIWSDWTRGPVFVPFGEPGVLDALPGLRVGYAQLENDEIFGG